MDDKPRINIEDLVRERQAGLIARRLGRIEMTGTASVDDLADMAQRHYDQLSTAQGSWNSVVPQAIEAWRRYDVLESEIVRLTSLLREEAQAFEAMANEVGCDAGNPDITEACEHCLWLEHAARIRRRTAEGPAYYGARTP